jgi:hypothetical protein
MRISILFLLLALSGPSHAYPQPTRLVSGMVISGEGSGPLEGVAVGVKGTNIISGSQQDGMFYIEVPANDSILVFAHDEYQTTEIRLAGGNEYHVVLNKGRNRPQTRAAVSVSGAWRAVFDIRPGVEVPFNFEIRTSEGGGLKAFFRNADEWFEGGRVLQTADSLHILLDQFDNELAFRLQPDGLSGVLRRQDGSGSPLPVRAAPGITYRFEDNGIPPSRDISGTYDVTFTTANGKEEKSVGLFRQQANQARGVEVISIQYERQTDSAFVRKVLTRMRQRYDIQYDQVFGGIADKQAVAASLPALNSFLAFPTTIFIDKKGRVAKIHTGYTGPATGQYYQDFVKEFNGEVDTLVRE